jgi:hypothetical protein
MSRSLIRGNNIEAVPGSVVRATIHVTNWTPEHPNGYSHMKAFLMMGNDLQGRGPVAITQNNQAVSFDWNIPATLQAGAGLGVNFSYCDAQGHEAEGGTPFVREGQVVAPPPPPPPDPGSQRSRPSGLE